ncbi:MAG: response regulator [Lacisediminihabitans sp.]
MSEPGVRVSVIVADDDPDIRTLVAFATQKAGLDLVDELGNGDDAWDSIVAFKPDLAVLDVAMPGKTGLELCRLVRADDEVKGMYIVLLSAAVDDASQRLGRDAGANDYLVKPFSPRELAEQLALIAPSIGQKA